MNNLNELSRKVTVIYELKVFKVRLQAKQAAGTHSGQNSSEIFLVLVLCLLGQAVMIIRQSGTVADNNPWRNTQVAEEAPLLRV